MQKYSNQWNNKNLPEKNLGKILVEEKNFGMDENRRERREALNDPFDKVYQS